MAKYGNWFENAAKVLGNKTLYSEISVGAGGTIDLSYNVNYVDDAITIPDGTESGQRVRLIADLAGPAVITGNFYATYNTLTLAGPLSGGVELVWTTVGAGQAGNWMIIGAVDGTQIALSTV